MKIIEECELILGRTLTPIEGATIIEISKEWSDSVILEAMTLSKDKRNPLMYFKKILYNIKNPVEKKKENEIVETASSGSNWLDNFLNEAESH